MSIGYSPNSPKSTFIAGLSNIEFNQLKGMLKNVTIGEKDGSFFTRSGFINPADGKKTNDSVEPTSQILIIDVDSSINPKTGEITEGGPPPELVAEFFKTMGWNFIIFRTHSHGAKGNRYRIVMLTDRPYVQAELGPTLDSVFQELHAAGLHIRNVNENLNWSLAWYLPRRPASDTSAFTYIEYDGFPVNVCDAEIIPDNVQNAIDTAKERRFNPLGNGLIRVFNNMHPINELLRQRGDIERSYNRFMYSKSTSGTAGIVLFNDIMYSHHGDDPLADGEAHDAFDIYRIINNKSLSAALAKLTAKDIIDYIDNESDEKILEDINRGLEFTSPQIQARVRKVLKQRLEMPVSVLKEEGKYFKKGLEDSEADEELSSHMEIVEDFLTQFNVKPISYAGQIYIFDGKIWEAQEVKSFQMQFAEQYKTNVLCKRGTDYKALCELLYNACMQKEDFFKDAPRGIAVANKFYEINDDGEYQVTPLLSDHKQRIHHEFDLDTNPPTEWLANLEKTFDTQEEIDLLQEIFAATLLGIMPGLKKAALFKGTGDSGKSTILHVLESFIPPPLRSASAPSDWGNKEYIGNIAGKMLNSVGEMDNKKRMSGNEFKKVIGNDVCEGRKLYVGVFNFNNSASHIFNANEFPPTSATDRAFFNRWVILEFKRAIPIEDRIRDYADILLSKERAQILNWIIQGAKRVIINNGFTVLNNHRELINLWEATVNPFLAFIQDTHHIEAIDNFMGIPASSRIYYTNDMIYKIYELWCRVNNVRNTYAVNKLIQKMKEHHLIERNPDNNYATLWTGIILHTDFSYTTKISLFDTDGIYQLDYKGNKL